MDSSRLIEQNGFMSLAVYLSHPVRLFLCISSLKSNVIIYVCMFPHSYVNMYMHWWLLYVYHSVCGGDVKVLYLVPVLEKHSTYPLVSKLWCITYFLSCLSYNVYSFIFMYFICYVWTFVVVSYILSQTILVQISWYR